MPKPSRNSGALGLPIAEFDIWHGTSRAKPAHLEQIDPSYLALWTDDERAWAGKLYESPGFRSVRERVVEIGRLLDSTPPGRERSRLVHEVFELQRR